MFPVEDKEAKNHTLSSGTSPYKPYKGIPPGGTPEQCISFTHFTVYIKRGCG